LGTNIGDAECYKILSDLGFKFKNGSITVPSYRSDIKNHNDLAEEIARVVGYDNIERESLEIDVVAKNKFNYSEIKLRKVLIDNGFYEVINNPFNQKQNDQALKVDNPLDSNKQFLRTSLKNSLVDNLLYNERRQKDSLKFYEISNVYTSPDIQKSKRVVGIIATGRQGKSYSTFHRAIDENYILNILKDSYPEEGFNIIKISRETLDTKIKNKIFYIEFEIDQLPSVFDQVIKQPTISIPSKKYKPISEYPSSFRDLSFSVKNSSKCIELQKLILEYNHNLLKEVFIFDYFVIKENEDIKIGFRFVFQSASRTITESDVNKIMENIINRALLIETVTLPGFNN
jgi:phenylalanyl-tRNA synthetase beta chain